MKRKLPPKMKIGFRTYNIKRANKKEAEEAGYIGITIMQHNEIRLRDDVSDEELKSTLLHELCHALMYDSGMSQGLSEKKEEQWCQFFSASMMQLIRDPLNWKVLEWIHSQEKIELPPYKVTSI